MVLVKLQSNLVKQRLIINNSRFYFYKIIIIIKKKAFPPNKKFKATASQLNIYSEIIYRLTDKNL